MTKSLISVYSLSNSFDPHNKPMIHCYCLNSESKETEAIVEEMSSRLNSQQVAEPGFGFSLMSEAMLLAKLPHRFCPIYLRGQTASLSKRYPKYRNTFSKTMFKDESLPFFSPPLNPRASLETEVTYYKGKCV